MLISQWNSGVTVAWLARDFMPLIIRITRTSIRASKFFSDWAAWGEHASAVSSSGLHVHIIIQVCMCLLEL